MCEIVEIYIYIYRFSLSHNPQEIDLKGSHNGTSPKPKFKLKV